jgi:phenylacetate-CoA ligase
MILIAIRKRNFLKYYNFMKNYKFESYKNLRRYQEEKLHELIQFCYYNVPYYNKLFNKLNLKIKDINSIEDLQKLPILTKKIIRNNQKIFIPNNIKKNKYSNCSTGGSTGFPLQYRISKEDQTLCKAIKYLNWEYVGYKLGDKIAIIAGSRLFPSLGSKYRDQIRAYLMNSKIYSSFDLNYEYSNKILADLNKFKPKFIRGYASSIYLFSKFLKDNNLRIAFQTKGIFTTSEVLLKYQRKTIEEVFNCEVFDQYGLNDGGVSAYECKNHNGLHIDMFRSILEIVDEEGNQLNPEEEGRILATSLYNYAMPFIRYETGDLGILSDEKCECGRNLPLLKKVIGRTTDYLKFSNDAIIGSPILTVLFGKFDIIQYQIIQKEIDKLLIYIIKGEKYSIDNENEIKKILCSHAGKIDIEFRYVNRITPTKAGKWKFILRELDK